MSTFSTVPYKLQNLNLDSSHIVGTNVKTNVWNIPNLEKNIRSHISRANWNREQT